MKGDLKHDGLEPGNILFSLLYSTAGNSDYLSVHLPINISDIIFLLC